jgi:pimeloyl-ACP methyl ester carboxylesterase
LKPLKSIKMKNLKKSLSIATGLFSLLGLGLALRTSNAIKKAENNFPALGKFCNIQGCAIHYFSEGNGPVIVLLHGENGDLYDFYLSPLWQKLKGNYRLIAFDRPGNGYSRRVNWKDYGFRNQGEIIHQAIQHLGLKDPLLVSYGESSGIVLSMLMEHEDSYKGAVLLEDKVTGETDLSDKIISLPVIGNLFLWTVYPVMAGKKVNTAIAATENSEEYRQKAKTLDNHPSKLLSSSENKKFMNIEELEKLSSLHSEIKKPVTVIHSGSSEGNGNLTSSFKLANIVPHLKVIPVPGSENLLSLADSDRVVDEINKLIS